MVSTTTACQNVKNCSPLLSPEIRSEEESNGITTTPSMDVNHKPVVVISFVVIVVATATLYIIKDLILFLWLCLCSYYLAIKMYNTFPGEKVHRLSAMVKLEPLWQRQAVLRVDG